MVLSFYSKRGLRRLGALYFVTERPFQTAKTAG